MTNLAFTEPVIEPILFIMCLGLAIASIEDYVRSHIFQTYGILSWDVLKYSNPTTLKSQFWKIIGWFQAPPAFRYMFLTRMLVSLSVVILLLLGVKSAVVLFPLILCLLTAHLLISLRSLYGLDGAHQMNLILLLGATLFYISTPGSFAQKFCILFIGAQSITAYVVSGIYKGIGKKWRDGTAISGIMCARIYGHPWLGSFLRQKPMLCKIMCWMIIFFETAFILNIFAPPAIVYILLAFGVAFHLLNAVFMGLNGFFFSFIATYSSVIYLNHYIRTL